MLWEDDRRDFTDVTVGVGRLQKLLREWSPSFAAEIDHLEDGRRTLLLRAPGEPHTPGASMVAEFFRRAGWDVVGGVCGSGLDPVQAVQGEWFDIPGLAAGSPARADWLRACVAGARRVSLFRGLDVLVGGPLFVVDPGAGDLVGSDAVVTDGERGPERAEALLALRTQRLRGGSPTPWFLVDTHDPSRFDDAPVWPGGAAMTAFSRAAASFADLDPDAFSRLAAVDADVSLVIDAAGVVRDVAVASNDLPADLAAGWRDRSIVELLAAVDGSARLLVRLTRWHAEPLADCGSEAGWIELSRATPDALVLTDGDGRVPAAIAPLMELAQLTDLVRRVPMKEIVGDERQADRAAVHRGRAGAHARQPGLGRRDAGQVAPKPTRPAAPLRPARAATSSSSRSARSRPGACRAAGAWAWPGRAARRRFGSSATDGGATRPAACATRGLAWITGAAVMAGGQVPTAQSPVMVGLYSLGAHGIMTCNDFKAVAGDRQMGIRSLPVMLGVARAAEVAVWVMALPQPVVVGLPHRGHPGHALAVGGLLAVQAVQAVQAVMMTPFVRSPVKRALW